ncbi:LysR family transcriptional regulator [Prosthecodimorpha staleyi]|uniref:LysR family transcriptional regulator n=1 Tax=Prosthecodimorpha staleyi TaxID=2840188 RepID=A0A947D345_9HYPH|nr:LysR family transcriptional regulator [Prosthecodimorpha staleyi]MBT9289885.1 LysR family transcriptional regulator [Prosthecodimorpha staleyi]
MKFNQLEVFCTLMTAGTMTRTSELLGITQPAVSVAIAGLERDLGFALFHRRGGRLVPKEEARNLFTYAIRSLEAMSQTRLAADQIRQGRLGTLAIAAYPSISVAFVPSLLTQFRRDHPDIEIRLVTRSSHVIRDFASARQFDITISELPVSHSEMAIEPVALECLCMMPLGHPLASRETITPHDLDGVPFVSILRDHMTFPQIAAAFQTANAQRRVVAEVQYFMSAAALIADGNCVGIIDPITAGTYAGRAVFRRFVPAIRYEFGLITSSEGELSIPARNFLRLLRAGLEAVQSGARTLSRQDAAAIGA